MKRKYLERPFELKSVSDTGSFTGYGSVFGELDSHRDIVMPGAFKESLQIDFIDKKRKVPMLWQHDSWNPIGVYDEIYEDEHGLFVKGQCNLDVQQGRECHALMKQGALSGLSIGYNTLAREYEQRGDDDVVRKLFKVKLWEVSPVTFPSGDEARVEQVKSALESANTLSEIESHLREAYDMSRKETALLIARVKSACLLGDPAEPERAGKISAALRELRSINID